MAAYRLYVQVTVVAKAKPISAQPVSALQSCKYRPFQNSVFQPMRQAFMPAQTCAKPKKEMGGIHAIVPANYAANKAVLLKPAVQHCKPPPFFNGRAAVLNVQTGK
jgi:hypothetical protein